MKREIFRIIDANLNRSREGLRVCEDIARFALSSKTITAELKSVRHSVSDIAVSSCKKFKDISRSRDSRGDVLRRSGFQTEMKRCDTADIFAANIERVKESLRVMEEFFKLIDKRSSSRLCGLRFKVYSIEKKALARLDTVQKGKKR